jgi:RND family efflux transporter MFP subunit
MKSWVKWTAGVLVVLLLSAGVLRALSARKAQKEALDAQQIAQKTQTAVELAPTDLVQARTVELSQGLAISGPLKAVSSAFVKARVAGELQGLSVREGDFVKVGDVIARIDSTEYQARARQAEQQAQSAKAQVDIAKRSFDNNRSLVEQGFISKTALDSSIATLASAEATYRASMAGSDVAAKSLGDTVLRAPISGQISQRLAQPGERVAIDARIVEVVDLGRIELEASLSAADSLTVKVGQAAQLTVEGVSKPLAAKVARVNPSAVAGSRAVLVYLSIESSPGLRQGLFAQGTLGTGATRALAVPLSAVRTDKPQPYVQLLSDGKVIHQTVELGARGDFDGQAMVAVQGVKEGSTVLNGTVGTVIAGTLVKTTAITK